MMSSRAVRRWFQGYYFAYLVALITGLWLTIRTRRQQWWAILLC
jgi:uncharacterized membrane protein YfhO